MKKEELELEEEENDSGADDEESEESSKAEENEQTMKQLKHLYKELTKAQEETKILKDEKK